MSLHAAPTMLGTSTMRRTRISSPLPSLHPCRQACTLRPRRTRYLQDIILITEQLLALISRELKVVVVVNVFSLSSRIRPVTQKLGCHTDWHRQGQKLQTSRTCRRRTPSASTSMARSSGLAVTPTSTRPQVRG